MTQKKVAKWDTVTGDSIAEAIIQVTNGDCRKLVQSTAHKNGIWDEVWTNLGPSFNTVSDKIWAESVFSKNFQNCRRKIKSLCKVKGLQYFARPVCNVPSESTQLLQVYCICKTHEQTVPEHDMIQCDKCEAWYHVNCMNISIKKYKHHKSIYKCPKCRGDPPDSYIPTMFRNETYLNMTSLDLQETMDESFNRKFHLILIVFIFCHVVKLSLHTYEICCQSRSNTNIFRKWLARWAFCICRFLYLMRIL